MSAYPGLDPTPGDRGVMMFAVAEYRAVAPRRVESATVRWIGPAFDIRPAALLLASDRSGR
ncbi:hypothetical protein V5P93_007058 [Actinokineospora auranticolor]|uniref:Uncharacterized protein n=1 Tax=Actinokineospora auranticolor TaxID=155976 RepID=A0A2S6GGZ2_9PSEU|nr:hypothetical protein [Actinokineospora auranticolor]PPK64492.1 hypothetical protein CLV40_11956 [Actinokineospora auranticolor]